MSTKLDYTPSFDISVSNAGVYGKDYQLIEAILSLETPEGVEKARRLYELGAFCQSYAKLPLKVSLIENIAKGSTVLQGEILGVVYKDAKVNDSILEVQYVLPSGVLPTVGANQLCSVGGNPDPQLDECFSESGQLQFIDSGFFLDYEGYNAAIDTFNGISLQKLSTGIPIANSYPATLQTYVDYYGVPHYADKFIKAALERRVASDLPNGNHDFSILTTQMAANSAIELGTLTMSCWMNVILTMDKAVQSCETETDKALEYWDDAVAFYRGIGLNSDDPSSVLENLATVYAKRFGTQSEDEQAQVNKNLQQWFTNGKMAISNSNCDSLQILARDIEHQMIVPLVQGLFYNAYEVDVQNNEREITQIETSTFSAALLPMLHKCSEGNAALVSHNTLLSEDVYPSFQVIKDAVERQYSCLGITCEDVGGIKSLSSKLEYVKDGEPCGWTADEDGNSSSDDGNSSSNNNSSNSNGNSNGSGVKKIDNSVVIAVSVCLPIAALLLILLICRRSKSTQKETVFTATTDGISLEVDAVGSEGHGTEHEELKVKEIV